MVAGVLEGQGVSREDWEQSLEPDYRVDPLMPPEWSVSKPPGQHHSVVEDALADRWRAQPEIMLDQLLQQLDHFARGMRQACSYHSQESYFRYNKASIRSHVLTRPNRDANIGRAPFI